LVAWRTALRLCTATFKEIFLPVERAVLRVELRDRIGLHGIDHLMCGCQRRADRERSASRQRVRIALPHPASRTKRTVAPPRESSVGVLVLAAERNIAERGGGLWRCRWCLRSSVITARRPILRLVFCMVSSKRMVVPIQV
jgi:hypothetical protein